MTHSHSNYQLDFKTNEHIRRREFVLLVFFTKTMFLVFSIIEVKKVLFVFIELTTVFKQ
jgi:hypothetical protein